MISHGPFTGVDLLAATEVDQVGELEIAGERGGMDCTGSWMYKRFLDRVDEVQASAGLVNTLVRVLSASGGDGSHLFR